MVSLFQTNSQCKQVKLSRKKSILFQVVANLSYLHKLAIINRDLKPQTIYQRIPRTKIVLSKLGDFSLSKKWLGKSLGFSITENNGMEDYIALEMRKASDDFESFEPKMVYWHIHVRGHHIFQTQVKVRGCVP